MSARLPVNEIYLSIQGEGYYTGMPCVLVRLQGCDVGCPWCDTKHTWNAGRKDELFSVETLLANREASAAPSTQWSALSVDRIAYEIDRIAPSVRHVVITGGEPCMHDLTALTKELLRRHLHVQIETSGTYDVQAARGAWVTVSPKIGMPGKRTLSAQAMLRADEIKMVIGATRDVKRLRALVDQYGGVQYRPVYVQPLSQRASAMNLCLAACYEYGYRLSVQTHLYLGLP